MAQKRKTISKKLRFEVFKRDNFTCQYCGRMAPDIVLEVDHINPVKNGGDNNILNLITSCFDCNRGKGKRLLNQNDEIKKQQEMLKEINKKREQLEMLIKWKQELRKLDEKMVDEIEEILKVTNSHFSEYGRKNCLKNIKKYGFEEVYESTKISVEQYYNEDDEESVKKTFDYIEKICAMREKQRKNPNLYKINYLIKIAKNRLSYINEAKLRKLLEKNYTENDFEILKSIFCDTKSWTELYNDLYEIYMED